MNFYDIPFFRVHSWVGERQQPERVGGEGAVETSLYYFRRHRQGKENIPFINKTPKRKLRIILLNTAIEMKP